MNLKLKNIIWVYAFLLLAMAYITGLFIDLTGDSGLYAAIARQMVESGDWFNLKINGNPYEQKPHVFFWLAGMGIKIFGNSNFGFKIFPALYGWLSFYFTYKLGKTLFSENIGKLAALTTVTSQIFFLYSFDIHTDSILQTGVVLALWQLTAYLRFNKKRNFIFGFIGVGLAMLAKGPIGGVLPFFTVLFFLLAQKKFRQILHPKWLLGLIIALLIISPTLFHLYKSFGWLGIQFFFITNNIGRITGDYLGSNNDPFFYLYNALWMFLPWTVFVFSAVFSEIKSWFSKREKDIWGVSLLGGVFILLVILSISKGKAPNYFLIVVPPVLVITAKWINVWWKKYTLKNKNLLRTNYAYLSLFGLLFLLILFFYGESDIWNYIPLLILSAVAILLAFKNISNPVNRTFYISILFAGIFNIYLNTHFIPELTRYQGAIQVLEIFEKNRKPGEILYNFELEEYELFFMAEDSVREVKDWNVLYEIMEQSGTWLYTNSVKHNDIIKMKYDIDTVYQIRQRGMNKLNIQFLNPNTREKALKTNYLMKTK